MLTKSTFLALFLTCVSVPALAEDITIRVHHFMTSKATLHAQFLAGWKQAVEQASQGRIKIELNDSMSLGGKPGDLYDQAVDGAVEVVLTLPGYTPGRFNRTEVFELPFFMNDAEATSLAFYDFVQAELQDDEYSETKILAGWVHGPGVIHSKEPINHLEDIKGKSLRGPTRLSTKMLATLGASPVGMPLPAIPENLSKGVIDGTMLPWEVTPSIKLAELVHNHTEFTGGSALYTATFILAMNWDAYENLPQDLRTILDEQSGKMLSGQAARMMVNADTFGRSKAQEAGNNIITLHPKEVARWVKAAQSVYPFWIKDADGFDGQKTIDRARELIEANK